MPLGQRMISFWGSYPETMAVDTPKRKTIAVDKTLMGTVPFINLSNINIRRCDDLLYG
jgi:hypothetical protein